MSNRNRSVAGALLSLMPAAITTRESGPGWDEHVATGSRQAADAVPKPVLTAPGIAGYHRLWHWFWSLLSAPVCTGNFRLIADLASTQGFRPEMAACSRQRSSDEIGRCPILLPVSMVVS